MTIIRDNIQEYTESEFLKFIRDIYNANCDSEAEHTEWVKHFAKLVQHPKGNGLIFYPEGDDGDSPEGILKTVVKWRKDQGLPLFKDSEY